MTNKTVKTEKVISSLIYGIVMGLWNVWFIIFGYIHLYNGGIILVAIGYIFMVLLWGIFFKRVTEKDSEQEIDRKIERRRKNEQQLERPRD